MAKLNNFRRFAAVLSRSKFLILALACSLIIGGLSGGTVAWLMGKSAPVTNTFTYGDISLSIVETDTGLDEDNNPDTNTYKMMPSAVIEKDPQVIFHGGSEDSWLFVEIKKSENFDTFLSYAVAQGWNALDGVENVYWRSVQSDTADQSFPVLEGNQVQVKADVTAYMLNSLTDATLPSLTFTAYAVQEVGVADAAAAWNAILTQPVIVP
ncbi:MAG: hypothetical protein IJD39_09385 [Clostridia bacterium]|nr:hypothetical protein [Clostridia bacterium]